MNSTKETKNTTKLQKKSQKVNKKQQQQQQQQQQLQQIDKNGKNVKNANVNANSTKASAYGVNKLTGKTAKIPTIQIANNNNNNNNNNSNMQNNNNIAQRLKEHYEAEKKAAAAAANGSTTALPPRAIIPGYDNAPKFERSSSFSLRGKLSKFINSITSSKENLNKIDDDLGPTKFTRSRSMILLRRTNRRSLIEPQLEQLSEEAEKLSDLTSPASPRKNSIEPAEHVANRTDVAVTADIAERTPNRDNIQPIISSTPNEGVELRRKPSLISLGPGEGNGVPFNPQLNFQKRRSNTLIGSFRNTLAGLTGDKKKKEKCNPKWSASLQSLQAIDNMVSYENMSFIDYDKFNGYEKQLEKRLSTMSLLGPDADANYECTQPAITTPLLPLPVSPSYTNLNATPQTVVRRRKSRSTQKLAERNSSCSTFNFDTADYEHNLDKIRNVYRYSLDSRKLELLNDISRKSFVFDKHIVDVLNLEVGSLDKRKSLRAQKQNGADDVDSNGVTQKQTA